MNNIHDNVILTDCDGVLVDWLKGFTIWMIKHGHPPVDGVVSYDLTDIFGITKDEKNKYVRMFNESAYVGSLNPLRDAMYYIDLLHRKHGYVFHMITAMSDDPMAAKLRIQNIEGLFGKTAFERFTILDRGADKTEALREYKDSGCWWIEDKISNAEIPYENNFDIHSILMLHNHSMETTTKQNTAFTLANNWRDVYQLVTGE